MPRQPGMKFKDGPPEKDEGTVVAEEERTDIAKRFDWRKERYRILVAPQESYSISVVYYEEEPTASGGTVRSAKSKPLSMRVLTGGTLDRLGYGDLDLPDIPDPGAGGNFKHERHNRFYHELPEVTRGSEVLNPQVATRIPLYGCQLRVDDATAESYGFLFKKKEDQDPLEALVQAITSRKQPFSLYGRKYAFIDDEEGMRKLMPKFAQLVRDGAWSKDDVNEIFRGEPGESKVGPRLSAVEPHRFEKNPKTGRLW